jgi:hypothetical protein
MNMASFGTLVAPSTAGMLQDAKLLDNSVTHSLGM